MPDRSPLDDPRPGDEVEGLFGARRIVRRTKRTVEFETISEVTCGTMEMAIFDLSDWRQEMYYGQWRAPVGGGGMSRKYPVYAYHQVTLVTTTPGLSVVFTNLADLPRMPKRQRRRNRWRLQTKKR